MSKSEMDTSYDWESFVFREYEFARRRVGFVEAHAVTNEMLRTMQRSGQNDLLLMYDLIRGHREAHQFVRAMTPYMLEVAITPFDFNLMRAIVFEETAHQKPPNLESMLESMGFGDSVGPSQMRVSMWADRYGVSRQDLMDPAKHFYAMRRHLDYLRGVAVSRGMDINAATLGSLWNNGAAGGISPYGWRVDAYYAALSRASESHEPSPSPVTPKSQSDSNDSDPIAVEYLKERKRQQENEDRRRAEVARRREQEEEDQRRIARAREERERLFALLMKITEENRAREERERQEREREAQRRREEEQERLRRQEAERAQQAQIEQQQQRPPGGGGGDGYWTRGPQPGSSSSSSNYVPGVLP